MVRWRSKENFAASASMGSPSWNLTFGPQPNRHRPAVVGGVVRQRELGHDAELDVDVEELVAQRGEDDAPDIGAGERRIEHIRILGEPDAQRRLRRAEADRGGERGRGEQRGGETRLFVPLPVMLRKPLRVSGVARRGVWDVPSCGRYVTCRPAKASNRRSRRGSTSASVRHNIGSSGGIVGQR